MFDLLKRCPTLRRLKASNDLTKLESASQKAHCSTIAGSGWSVRNTSSNYPCAHEIFHMDEQKPARAPVSFIVGADDEYVNDNY
jgi:hypothetical protein